MTKISGYKTSFAILIHCALLFLDPKILLVLRRRQRLPERVNKMTFFSIFMVSMMMASTVPAAPTDNYLDKINQLEYEGMDGRLLSDTFHFVVCVTTLITVNCVLDSCFGLIPWCKNIAGDSISRIGFALDIGKIGLTLDFPAKAITCLLHPVITCCFLSRWASPPPPPQCQKSRHVSKEKRGGNFEACFFFFLSVLRCWEKSFFFLAFLRLASYGSQ